MPLPKPKKGEKENDFISRCMSNKTMKKEFPDQKQRTAVCYDQWRKEHSSENVDAGMIGFLKEGIKQES